MTPRPLSHIVIAGGGTAGWMTAAALARFTEGRIAITLVESEEIGTVGVGEATIPQIRLFNQALGIDEADFLAAVDGTIKLGIEFVDWSAPGTRYMHAFGTVGRDLGLVPFHHHWLKARRAGNAQPLGAYALNEVAARMGRYGPGRPATQAALPPLAQAYHFDAARYATFLRRYAEARGVVRVEGRIGAVERDGERLQALVLADGRRIDGDFFVDCTGFRSLLLGETLGSRFEAWREWLPCDRAVAMPCAQAGPLTPYTRATARAAGWQWRIPLQSRTGNGYVYASADISDDEATATLLAHCDGEALAEPRLLRFTAGRRATAWIGNCVGIGLASGFLEPLESTSIHLIQTAIARLLTHWPRDLPAPAASAEYNRATALEIERIRDFVILHYKATSRADTPFWARCRDMAVPAELARRIALFRETGRLIRIDEELFTEPGWLQVLVGQGILPQAHHPLADALSDAESADFCASIAALTAKAAATFPAHDAFLARIAA